MAKFLKQVEKGLGDPIVAVGLIGAAAPALAAPVLGQVKAQLAGAVPYSDLVVDGAALAGGAYLAAAGTGVMRYVGAALAFVGGIGLVNGIVNVSGLRAALPAPSAPGDYSAPVSNPTQPPIFTA